MDLTLRTETFAVDDTSWLASRHGVGEAVSVTLDTSAFTPSIHYPDGFFKSGIGLAKIAATGLYGPYNVTDEVQTLTEGGSGLTSFTITWNGQTTASIDDDATAAEVQAALEALSNIGVVLSVEVYRRAFEQWDIGIASSIGVLWVATLVPLAIWYLRMMLKGN
jgi:hypothetical protein